MPFPASRAERAERQYGLFADRGSLFGAAVIAVARAVAVARRLHEASDILEAGERLDIWLACAEKSHAQPTNGWEPASFRGPATERAAFLNPS